MLFYVAEGQMTLGMEGLKALPHVKVEHIIDSSETGHRTRYQIAEVLIYFGWPTFVMWAVKLIWPGIYLVWLGALGVLLLLWPFIKGAIVGRIVAKVEGIRNPKKAIRSSSFWFDGFLFIGAPALTEIRKFSALSRSLDVIYNWFGRFGIRPKEFPQGSDEVVARFNLVKRATKAWTSFWIGMPIAQDVRSRLEIIAEEYRKTINYLAAESPGRTVNILEIAGGQIQAAAMGIARAITDGAWFGYQVVSIEPDRNFARTRASEIIQHFGLDEKCFYFVRSGLPIPIPDRHIGSVCSENGFKHSEFDIVVCIGLGDYFHSRQRVIQLLKCFDGGGKQKIITANITDNWIERWFLHILIQWPMMKYRSLAEWSGILADAYGRRYIRIIQTPHRIFNIAVIE